MRSSQRSREPDELSVRRVQLRKKSWRRHQRWGRFAWIASVVLAVTVSLVSWTRGQEEGETPATAPTVAEQSAPETTAEVSRSEDEEGEKDKEKAKDKKSETSEDSKPKFNNTGEPESENAEKHKDNSKKENDEAKKTKDKSKKAKEPDYSASLDFFGVKFQPDTESESEEGKESKEEADTEEETIRGIVAGGSHAQAPRPVQAGLIPPVQLDVERIAYPLTMNFSDGVHFRAKEQLFDLTIHDETQIDVRDFSHTAPGDTKAALHDTFNLPRQRIYFNGRITSYMHYVATLDAGNNGDDHLLNAYLDFGPKDNKLGSMFRFRIGRFKTPYSFEWYKIHNWQLVTLERPVFVQNFTTNRQVGAMAHGLLLNGTLEYAGGVFNGAANSYYSYNNGKDFIMYLDEAPFLHTDIPFLRFMHVAGSFVSGVKSNMPNEFPYLRTAYQGPPSFNGTTTSASAVSPTFLTFNDGVVERGLRDLWSGTFYWFYHSFNLFAEYNGGFIHYAASTTAAKVTRVPLEGFAVTASYFLTGEEETQRVLPQPLHPILGVGRGYGAWEVYSRFSNVNVGSDVFTAGLVDPSKWANRVNMENTGVNWFLNKWTRITLEWQHSNFNREVYLSSSKSMNFENIYWMRFQIFY